jgi:hypothetical protein
MLRPGIVPLLLTSLLVVGCASPNRVAPPEGALSAAEIRALFTGHTVKSVTFSKGTVRETYYMANGEIRRLRNGEVRKGTWRVRKNGRLCQQVGDHEESCHAIVRAGDTHVKYVVRKNGDHRPVVRYISFTPGNPLRL